MVSSVIHVGRGLLPEDAAAQRLPAAHAAFHRDARFFLKQLANQLGLQPGGYTITVRPAAGSYAGEVVLRTTCWLMLVSRSEAGASFAHACFEPGRRIADQTLARSTVTEIMNGVGQARFIDACRASLLASRSPDRSV